MKIETGANIANPASKLTLLMISYLFKRRHGPIEAILVWFEKSIF